VITIPTRSLPAYTISVTLENVPYLFTFKWNVRGAYFTLDILTRDAQLLIGGIKVVINSGLIRKFPKTAMPPGELFALDSSGGNAPITFEDLEERVELVYASEDEYDAIQ
jgi:hypothetical protein